MSNFLELPTKTATPLPTFSKHLLDYISTHFHDAHPEAFRQDVETLVGMRKDWVESKAETHPEVVKAFMRYNAQLCFLATKFPSDINLPFTYHLPFPPTFALSPDAPISLSSLTFERTNVLYNMAALYGSMAAQERRSEAEGIKRSLGYLTAAAGILQHLITAVLPTLVSELSSPHAAGYDMSESFLGTMKEFVLAEAQECYWQQAVLQGTYKNGLIGKLSMKVSEYYKAALTSMNGTDYPSQSFFPSTWISHITIKQMHFESAAHFRQSQEELEKSRYGEEIARLKLAESLAKKGLDAIRKGVADSVVNDLKQLQATIKASLSRAIRDNDLVYVQPIPPANQLAAITGVGMVKVNVPEEIKEPIKWLMSNSGGGGGALFAGLVPYGVHLALSIYDDRKDTIVRELDGKREELDGLAASTLQSLNLPGSIQALDRPVGLPPSLIKKSEEVFRSGGVDRIHSLLDDVRALSAGNVQTLNDSMDILDQEASENETLLARQPDLQSRRQPSHVANKPLIDMAVQYEATIKQAAGSDASVRAKFEEWAKLITILASGEDEINEYVPSTSSQASLPPTVRPLRLSLEEQDDLISHRARLVQDAKQISKVDDIRPEVLEEASKLAHGGMGDVKVEWFEEIFEKNLKKYEDLKGEMENQVKQQEELLDQIRTQNESFISERKTDPVIKQRESRLQDMDLAYWRWREVVDNAEEGLNFYRSLADMLGQFKTTCAQFLNSRRVEVGQISAQLQNMSIRGPSPPQQTISPPPSAPSPAHFQPSPHTASGYTSPAPAPKSTYSPAPLSNPAPAPAPAPRPAAVNTPSAPAPFLAHPSSSNWQSDFLPPPPPPPILRSGGIQSQPKVAPPLTPSAQGTPRRVTRASASAAATGKQDDGTERNKYREAGSRRKGGGVV